MTNKTQKQMNKAEMKKAKGGVIASSAWPARTPGPLAGGAPRANFSRQPHGPGNP